MILTALLLVPSLAATPAPAAPQDRPAATITPAGVLRTMELVADWQLARPRRYVVSIQTGERTRTAVRIASDGTVLERRERPARAEVGTSPVPQAWSDAAECARSAAATCAVPPEVALTAARETRPGAPASRVESDYRLDGWEMGTLYAGLMALAGVSEQPRYLDALRLMGSALGWRLGEPPYGANGHCVGQMYLGMYTRFNDPAMLSDVEARFDWILKHPPGTDLRYGAKADRWTWSDALFMAPPVWARLAAITGDRRYLDFMDREWWATTDHLYVKEQRLFYRDDRFATRRELNGERIFWSRGNGWVVAGLARVLEALPERERGRARYVTLLREMSSRIAALQPPDGLWRPSLLDPAGYPTPETSGSALFCYALAWGMRHGILDRDTYWPVVERAWQGLARSVRADGRLGWVQLPASLPERTTEEMTAPYGVGAFLLAGSEVHALLTGAGASAPAHP